MLNTATGQPLKRLRDYESADISAGSNYQDALTWQKHSGGGVSSFAESHQRMKEELGVKPFDPVATDKVNIEEELRSGSSVLILERTQDGGGYCRARFCLRQKLIGIISIESDYRFNVKDLTGKRSVDLTHYLRKSHSCGVSVIF